MGHKPLYLFSRYEAKHSKEIKLWNESYNENCRCARAIDGAIVSHYNDYYLYKEVASKIILTYGFERVNWVLANTVQLSNDDGRYSAENKEWAFSFRIPQDGHKTREMFSAYMHPALVNIFINQVRERLYEYSDFHENSRIE